MTEPILRGRWPSALVLAGLLAVALWALLRAGGPPSGTSVTIRPITSTEVAADVPLLLAWEGAGPPFRVEILDPEGRTIWISPPLPQALVRVPDGVRRRLAEGSSCSWSVEGVDSRNRPVRSEPFPLRIRPSGPAPI